MAIDAAEEPVALATFSLVLSSILIGCNSQPGWMTVPVSTREAHNKEEQAS